VVRRGAGRAVIILVVGLALMVGVALAINGLGDGGASPARASLVPGGPFDHITGLATDAAGTLSVETAGGWVTLAPDGTTAPAPAPPPRPDPAELPITGMPGPVAEAPDGAVFFVDGTTVRRQAADGSVLTIAGGGTLPVTEFDDVAATDLSLPDVRGLAVDPGGHVYLSGSWGLGELSPGGRLREITTDQPIPVLGPIVAPALGVIVGAADTQLVRVQLSR
jgi:hypothetical protein